MIVLWIKLRTSSTSGSLRFVPLWIKGIPNLLKSTSKREICKLSYGNSLDVHKQKHNVKHTVACCLYGGEQRKSYIVKEPLTHSVSERNMFQAIYWNTQHGCVHWGRKERGRGVRMLVFYCGFLCFHCARLYMLHECSTTEHSQPLRGSMLWMTEWIMIIWHRGMRLCCMNHLHIITCIS